MVRTSGANYWTNTDYLRVGYCAWSGCTPYAVARSYFDFSYPISPRNGLVAQINTASVTVPGRSTASSYATPVTLSRAGAISAGQTWGGPLGAGIESVNTTAASPSAQFADGNVIAYAQQASRDSWDSITFALTSPNEANRDQWKTFGNNPTLNVTYTYPPITPSNLSAGGYICNETTWVNTTNVTLSASVSDNGNGSGIWEDFDVYNVVTGIYTANAVYEPSGVTTAALPFSLPDGTYYFITRSSARPGDSMWVYSPDVRSANFTVSASPTPPTAYSAAFPQDDGVGFPGYGVTRQEAVNQSASFTVIASGAGTFGFAYSWDSDTAPAPATCQANSPITATQPYGYVRAVNGLATIQYPTDSTSPTRLYLKAFTSANTMSALTIYKINPWPGASTSTTETSASQFSTSMTTSIDTTNTYRLSGGSEVRLSTTTTAKTATHTITTTSDGTYTLNIEFSTGPDRGTITLTPTATSTCETTGNEALTIDLHSTVSGKKSFVYANENNETGEYGWTCPLGGGTIAYQIAAPDTAGAGYLVDIDYARALKD